MKKIKLPRVMIVGTGSGCGKTTAVCALLKSFQLYGKKVSAFKCGPDYIDPMFHSKILETKSRNIDIYMCGEEVSAYLMAKNGNNSDICIVEGVMGMYDGLGFTDDSYSANHISRLFKIPEILVVNVRGKSLSLAAEINGYRDFYKNNLKGVILNECSEGMYKIYAELIKEKCGLETFGYLPNDKDFEIGSRHLGLITADEITGIKDKLDKLGETALKTLELDKITALAENAEEFEYIPQEISYRSNGGVKIAVARDKAFCFYYDDSLNLLEEMGAELIYFSPLNDEALPEDADGVILGGGYPEEYAESLSRNFTVKNSIREAAEKGVPIYGECGGFIYLGRKIRTESGEFEMCGVLDTSFEMKKRLIRFGYCELTSNCDNILAEKGGKIRAHEFHYSDGDNNGESFTAQKQSGRNWNCIRTEGNTVAGYPHINFWSNRKFGENFIKACEKYRDKKVGENG